MDSALSSGLTLGLIVFVVVLYTLRRTGLLGRLRFLRGVSLRRLSRLWPADKALVEKLVKQKAKEEAETVELDKVLVAKKDLAAAKAKNIAKRKQISLVSEQNLEGAEPVKKKNPIINPRG